jgi:hypothetical protein
MKKTISILLGVALLAGCASLKEYRVASQPLDIGLKTYPGGTIIKITKQRDLPNTMGKASLFGGKVDQGFIEVKYLGKIDSTRFALGIKEVTIESNETTVSRRAKDTASIDMSTSQDYTGRYETTGTITYNKRPETRTYVLPPDYHDFTWDLSKGKTFEIEGYAIAFASFDDSMITFTITKLQ